MERGKAADWEKRRTWLEVLVEPAREGVVERKVGRGYGGEGEEGDDGLHSC